MVALAFAVGCLWPALANASELVMFDQAGCIYCQRWERDVGALYDKTDEAKALPLRRVDIQNQKMSGVALASPIRFTPTFVVADNGREVGRITGYSNDNAFWGLLDALAAKLQPSREPNRI
jgi:thioredoxin-related protein